MIENILEKIKRSDVTIIQWITGFTGILFVRFLFEGLSSPTTSGVISSDSTTLVHYGLFFITTTLGIMCIVGYFSKNYSFAPKLILFGLPIIWLAPIIDIILSSGRGYKMTYIFDSHNRLFFDFFTFFGNQINRGATIGIRVEIAIILIGIGWYVWYCRKNILQAFFAVITSYTFIFFLATLPGIIYTIPNLVSGQSELNQVLNYLQNNIFNSNIFYNTLHDGNSLVSKIRFFELGFNKLMSQILFLLSLIFTFILFYKINKNKLILVLKNGRIERILFYLLLVLCGMGFAYINRYGSLKNWIDILSLIVLLLSWSSLWFYAVHTNDITDIDIDKISNPNRPLATGDLTKFEMQETGKLFLIISLLGTWVVGFYPFFMSLVYIATSYIYSTPPLRLRRIPLFASFLISIACLTTVLAGFFFISEDKRVQIFPIMIISGIIIMFTLGTNIRDMKDVEGDRKEGILTLPVIFKEKGPKVVGLCLALSFLLAPFFLSFYLLYIFAIPAAIIGYKLVTKKPYKEKYVFILYFAFFSCIFVSYFVIYFLANIYNLV